MNTQTDAQKIMADEFSYCAHNYDSLEVVLAKGKGVWLWDVQGHKYMDMTSAYSAVAHGHSHPKIVQTLIEQAQTLSLTSRVFHTDKLAPFVKKLCEMSGMDMALLMNTGTEAVETAIKAARLWGYQVKGIPKDRAEIIVAKNNFHGRTITVIGFSSDAHYRDGFGPFTPGFVSVDFGDIEAIKKAITPNTCAILIEPIQGEAGIYIPPDGYLKGCTDIAAQNNILCIFDEIQSGLGRTGKLFAHFYDGAKPDAIIVGKALGGGLLPVSALVGKRALMELFTPGSHGSTFGGNPLACSIGLAALEVLESEGLVQNSEKLGTYFLEQLQKIKAMYPGFIKVLRGRGLWIAMEIDPSTIKARTVCEAFLKQGILAKEVHNTIIRFSPPLIITRQELDWALDKIHAAFKTL